jgi:hypothetical protein
MSIRTSVSQENIRVPFLLLAATAILAACGSSSSGTATASSPSSASSSSPTTQPSGSGGGSNDIGGCESDRRRGVLYDIPEGDELDLGECRYNRRTRPRTWDDQRSDHHGDAGHRGTEWRRRICDILGGRCDPLPARGTDHVKPGRPDPARLQAGIGDDRQRNDSE